MVPILAPLVSLIALLGSFSLSASTYFAVKGPSTATDVLIYNYTTDGLTKTISIGSAFQNVFVSANGSIGGVAKDTVVLFNPITGALNPVINSSTNEPFTAWNLTFSDDGTTAYSYGEDKKTLFTIDTTTFLATDTGVEIAGPIQVSGDGSVVCCASSSGGVTNGLLLYNQDGSTDPIENEDGSLFDDASAFYMTPNGKTIYAGSSSSKIYIIDVASHKVIGSIPTFCLVDKLASDPNGSVIYARSNYPQPSVVWIIPTDGSAQKKVIGSFDSAQYTDLNTVAVSPDASTGYVYGDNTIYAIATNTGIISPVKAFSGSSKERILGFSMFHNPLPSPTPPPPPSPHAVIPSNTYCAVVAHPAQANVLIVQPSTGSVVKTIHFSSGFTTVFMARTGVIGAVTGSASSTLFDPFGDVLGDITLQDGTPFVATNIAFTDDGMTAYAFSGSTVFMIDTTTKIATDTTIATTGNVQVSRDGSVVCFETDVLNQSGLSLYYPETKTSVPIKNSDGSKDLDDVYSFYMTPNGKTIYASIIQTRGIYVIDVARAQVTETLATPHFISKLTADDTGSILLVRTPSQSGDFDEDYDNLFLIPTNGSPPIQVPGTFGRVSYTDWMTVAISQDGLTAYSFFSSGSYGVVYATAIGNVTNTTVTNPVAYPIYHANGLNGFFMFTYEPPTPSPSPSNQLNATALKQSDTWQTCIYNVVSWVAPPLVDHFEIFRNGVKVGAVASNTLSFQDKDVEPQTPYTYQVIAVLINGDFADLGTVTLTTQKD